MTRSEILAEYNVDSHGIITTPGKFESTYLWTPYWYAASLDGLGESLSDLETHESFSTLLEVMDEDRVEWPELQANTAFIYLEESSDGFIKSEEFTAEQADVMRAEFGEEPDLDSYPIGHASLREKTNE